MKREILIKEIIDEFSILQHRIEFLSENNLQDINLISEYHIQELLNILFDLKLTNSNQKSKNCVGIDLEDVDNRIAVQVTKNSRKTKIQETLDKFFQKSLHDRFSTLLIVILGKKLKKYSDLKFENEFNFNAEEHIIDFSTVVRKLSFLPTNKIEQIRNIFKNDKLNISNVNSVTIFRKKQAINKKLIKKLIRPLNLKDFEIIYFDPAWKFLYEDLIIRPIEDKSFPNFTDPVTNKEANWYKAFSHNLTEHYLEVQNYYVSDIIVNNKGEWNYFNIQSKKTIPEGLTLLHVNLVERIPLEQIVDVDDSYEDPHVFVNFINGKATEEELPFIRGYYLSEKEYRKVQYFELNKQNFDL